MRRGQALHLLLVKCSYAIARPKKNQTSRLEPLAAIALAMLSMGVTPTPPATSTTAFFGQVQKEIPARRLHIQNAPS